MDEAEVQRLVADGDVAGALGALHRAYHADVFQYLRRRVSSPAAADDLQQEVWLAAAEALPRFRFDCHPRVWLRVLARNKLVDGVRRRIDETTLDGELARPAIAGALLGVREPTTPTSRLQRADRHGALRRVLARISPDEREMLALRFVDGLKPAEIAVVMGLRANTMSQRLVRLVRRLRDDLHALEVSR